MPTTRLLCVKCKVNRWKSDYEDGNPSEGDHCLFCQLKSKFISINLLIENINNKIQSQSPQQTLNSDVKQNVVTLSNKVNDLTNKFENHVRVNKGRKAINENRSNLNEPRVNSEFIRPRRTVRSRPSAEFHLTVNNPFALLSNLEEEKKTVLLGDSIVKNMEREFCHRNKQKRSSRSIRGGKIHDLLKEVESLPQAESATLNVNFFGSNDVFKPTARVPELIQKYRSALSNLKAKKRNILVIGVIPRHNVHSRLISKAIYFNEQLKNLCSSENVHFSNLWNQFDKQNLFLPDGVHLNGCGNARLGRVLNEEVRKVWIKINDQNNLNELGAVNHAPT